jgi:hypothetical protein
VAGMLFSEILSKPFLLVAVLRWEFRPGAALYLVRSQNLSDGSHPGEFHFVRDLGDI